MIWQHGHNTFAIYTNQQSNSKMSRELEKQEHVLEFSSSEAE